MIKMRYGSNSTSLLDGSICAVFPDSGVNNEVRRSIEGRLPSAVAEGCLVATVACGVRTPDSSNHLITCFQVFSCSQISYNSSFHVSDVVGTDGFRPPCTLPPWCRIWLEWNAPQNVERVVLNSPREPDSRVCATKHERPTHQVPY